jgi:uncharacterized protein (DUF1800 family)
MAAATDTKSPSKSIDPAWAWAPYEPDGRRPWDRHLAAHLYRRAAFGADSAELEEAMAAGPQKSVDRLLKPPADAEQFQRLYDDYEAVATEVPALRAWWLRRMIQSPDPLRERMTLFWHSHFGVSAARVGDAALVGRHVRVLRRGALGRFTDLLDSVSRDPAVYLALGADQNRKTQPSEVLGRALLGQYTVGPGNYGEEDAREVARAMTGWFVLRGRLRWFEREHDDSEKTILGRRGRWGRQEVLEIASRRPATAAWIVGKLYRLLISETEPPSDELLAPLIEPFLGDGNLGAVVERMLRSNLFFSPTAYRQCVKSPVDWAVGMARAMQGLVPTERLGVDLADLGQDLYQPPTVRGWAGGESWINSATLIGRARLGAALLAPDGAYGGKLDPAALARKQGHRTSEAARRFFIDLLLGGDLARPVAATLPADAPDFASFCRQTAHVLVTLPEFHLA